MDTTTIVLAEKVQQMKLAEKNYLRHLSAPPDIKKNALKEYKKVEGEVDILLYAVLHNKSQANTYATRY